MWVENLAPLEALHHRLLSWESWIIWICLSLKNLSTLRICHSGANGNVQQGFSTVVLKGKGSKHARLSVLTAWTCSNTHAVLVAVACTFNILHAKTSQCPNGKVPCNMAIEPTLQNVYNTITVQWQCHVMSSKNDMEALNSSVHNPMLAAFHCRSLLVLCGVLYCLHPSDSTTAAPMPFSLVSGFARISACKRLKLQAWQLEMESGNQKSSKLANSTS